MHTDVAIIDPLYPDAEVLNKAAEILRSGGLVAFPTETVYGLGANALDENAVQKIFEAKCRPAHNPLIVHVHDAASAKALAIDWPEVAQRLAETFWPGSLTLVVRKKPCVPDIVTASGDTVALRMPSHPVALALLASAGIPVAAPSANRSTRLSPTTAEHARRDLEGRIDMILDGGPASGGLESTVLDVTARVPRLLRPGLVTPAQIEAVIGPIEIPPHERDKQTREILRSPGMMEKHYAPRTPLECIHEDSWKRVDELLQQGLRVGWLIFEDSGKGHPHLKKIVLPAAAEAYAARMYAALHELDDAGVDRIVVAAPPQKEEWLAVRDRLRRASAK